MARQLDDLKPVPADQRWRPLKPDPTARGWTDDFSNILSVLKWRCYDSMS